MPNAAYFRRQAEQLLRMARTTIDLNIAERLRVMAADFHERARELDKGSGFFPLRRQNEHPRSESDHG